MFKEAICLALVWPNQSNNLGRAVQKDPLLRYIYAITNKRSIAGELLAH